MKRTFNFNDLVTNDGIIYVYSDPKNKNKECESMVENSDIHNSICNDCAEKVKYIDPDVLPGREIEKYFPTEVNEMTARLRESNAILAENMANEMAEVYQKHINTILELGIQNIYNSVVPVMSLLDKNKSN